MIVMLNVGPKCGILMREASFKRVCLSVSVCVRVSVTVPLQICKMQKKISAF